jgi:uncharacterized protein (TIGR02147 family)
MIFVENYRDILKDLTSRRRRGELSKISHYLNVAPTIVSNVLSGARDLTIDQAFLVSDYFEFGEKERDYFITAVQKARSPNEKLSDYWSEKLKEIKASSETVQQKSKSSKELPDSVKAIYYSSYLYAAIRLYCSVSNGKTLDDIAARFKITDKKAESILKFLIEHNLVYTLKNKYVMSAQSLIVPKDSEFVSRHHSNWRLKALSHLSDVKNSELVYTCPCSIDEKTFNELKIDILNLIESAVKKTHAASSDNLACLNIDLFWIDS